MFDRSLRFLAISSIGLLAAACGDDPSPSGQGGQGQGGNGQGGGSAGECASDTSQPVTITVRNDSSVRLYFERIDTNVASEFIQVDGELFQDCNSTGTGALVVKAGYLDPGASMTRVWDGLWEVPLGSACCPLPRLRPSPQEFSVTVWAYRACDEEEGCECDLAVQRECSFNFPTTPFQGQNGILGRTTFAYDEQSVLVTFED